MKKVEYRFYEMPQGLPVLALTGERWEIVYGTDAMHFHNHLEIGYCHSGKGKIVFEDKEERYQPGTITFIPKNLPHRTEPVREERERIQKWEYLFLDVNDIVGFFFKGSPEKEKRLLKNINKQAYVLEKEDGKPAAGLIQMIFSEILEKGDYYKHAVKAYAFSLLLFFFRLQKCDGEQEIVRHTSIRYMKALIEYMEKHYMEEIDSESLSKGCNLSESYIRKLFLEYVNETPLGYLRLIRIDKACELLVETEKTVEVIAREVGYPAVSSFMRNFKKITGLSPAKWRKESWHNPGNIRKYHVSVLKGW